MSNLKKINIRNEPYILRFIPREETSINLKGTILDNDPLFHIETSSKYPSFAEEIKQSKYCVGIDEAYKNKIVDEASFIVCIYHYDKKYNERFVGFMIVHILPSGTLYLDVLCTNTTKYKYVGTILMQYLEKIKEIINSRKIMLNSLPSAVPFYEKLGYTMKRKMNFSGVNVPENVNLNYHTTHRMTKRNRSTTRIKRNRNTRK
jgi:hypothetical protein